jgi:hypothetical protein
VRVLTASDLPSAYRTALQNIVNQVSSITSGGITGFLEQFSDTMQNLIASSLPDGTTAARLLKPTPCSASASGCNQLFPTLTTPGHSISSIVDGSFPNEVIAHEFVHSLAVGHITMQVAGSALPAPLMSPFYNTGSSNALMTETEAEAFRAIRASGLAAGSTRAAAVTLKLVNP